MKTNTRSIRTRLVISYGSIVLIFLSVFITFNIIVINKLKTNSIDKMIENSTASVLSNIEGLIRSSVSQHLQLENDKLKSLAENYMTLSEEGYISREEAVSRIISLISEDGIGESGYSYAVDMDGIMVAHPVEEYRDRDFSWDEGIQRQLTQQEGYIEYRWQNPDDEQKREKMLFMSKLGDPEWIIASTAYADDEYISNIRLGEIGAFISNENINGLGYISLLDGEGGFVIPPDSGSENIFSINDAVKPFLPEMKQTRTGKIEVGLDERVSGSRKAVIFYSYFPAMDWMITGTGFPGELYRVIYIAYAVVFTFVLLSLIVFYFLNRSLSIKLTAPLFHLMDVLDSAKAGNLKYRADIATGDELEILGEHFNSFMEEQQQYIKKIGDAKRSIKLLAKFPDENPNPVIRLDDKGKIEYANDAAKKNILGPLGLAVGEVVPADTAAGLKGHESLSGRNEFTVDDRIYSFSASHISDPEGLYLYGRDISRQKKYESLQLLSDNIFRNSIEGIVITDGNGIIESVNPAFTKITGYPEEEVLGKNPRILKSHMHGKEFYKDMWDSLGRKGYWSGEIWNRRKNGTTYPENLTISSIRNEEGKVKSFISFFYDLTEIKEKEERILFEATHDKLTGLPNREFLDDYTGGIIAGDESRGKKLSFIYVDIKNFKRINESLGPESGDRLLEKAARRLSEIIKDPDIVARVGSDEFICMLNDRSGEPDIKQAVNEIIRVFLPAFVIKGREIDIEITAGISKYPDDGTVPLDLFAKAESAMHVSRKDINNQFIFYSPSFKKEGLTRLELESGLKSAFENNKFFLNYQPKVSAETGRIIGSEALLRMEPIGDQFIGPDVFIPVAEEIGLIDPLGAWVLEQACIDTMQILGDGFSDIHTAVNLSPWQFRKKELPNQITNIIASTGIPPENLNLEITESMAIDNVEDSIRIMKKLTDTGLSLSIDDFGTGYSSLSYLSSFPVDILKIDKAFINGVPDDRKGTGVVLAILALAENLGMKTVAEGVENETQHRFLRDRGCSQIQGYYFHKPMRFDDYLAALRKERNG